MQLKGVHHNTRVGRHSSPWHQALDNSNLVRVMFIDHAKAFDHVDRPTLVRKLLLKTKEMLIGKTNKKSPPKIFICSDVIERAPPFRLLSWPIHIDNNLKLTIVKPPISIPRRHLVCIYLTIETIQCLY